MADIAQVALIGSSSEHIIYPSMPIPEKDVKKLCTSELRRLQGVVDSQLRGRPGRAPRTTSTTDQSTADPTVQSYTMLRDSIVCIKEEGIKDPKVKSCLDSILDCAREAMYKGVFELCPSCWRELYWNTSVVKACYFILTSVSALNDSTYVMDGCTMSDVVQSMDLAAIMTGKDANEDPFSRQLMIIMEQHWVKLGCPPDGWTTAELWRKSGMPPTPDHYPTTEGLIHLSYHPSVPVLTPQNGESLFEAFTTRMLAKGEPDGPRPCIIPGVAATWNARKESAWKNPNYLLAKTLGGRRLVPIELGDDYVGEDWGQRIITVGEFVNRYLLDDSIERQSIDSTEDTPFDTKNRFGDEIETDQIGYLAQFDVFKHISSLRNDVEYPEYVFADPPPPHHTSHLAEKHRLTKSTDMPQVSAWIGPVDTTSPPHVDPYHNIFCQVVGNKYVRLWPPKEAPKLYPMGSWAPSVVEGEIKNFDVDMSNTSSVNVAVYEGWAGTSDEGSLLKEKYPDFAKAEWIECVVHEGEALYIPLGWWHYVRSLSTSMSVSFWWNKQYESSDLSDQSETNEEMDVDRADNDHEESDDGDLTYEDKTD